MFKYQKISDDIREYTINNANSKILKKDSRWIGTEKIHGSNFAIIIKMAKYNFRKEMKC